MARLTELIKKPHMFRFIAVLGVVLSMSIPIGALGKEPVPLVEPEVRQAVLRGGARVIVELRITPGFRSEGDLPGPKEIAAQRRAIAAAQAGVLSRLSGSSFKLIHKYDSVPLLSLEIGPDALAMLEHFSDLVSRVRQDATRRRMSLQPSSQ